MENEFASKLNFFEEKVKNYDYSIESFRQKLAALAREVEACKEALRQPSPALPAQLEALQSKINNFEQALQSISLHQSTLREELASLKLNYESLKSNEIVPEELVQAPVIENIPEPEVLESVFTEKLEGQKIDLQSEKSKIHLEKKPALEEVLPHSDTERQDTEKSSASLEDYIGGNLISKIGIVILVVGLGILLKYAIEQDLLSDLVKVLLAYTAGISLFGISLYLKNKYFSYSAVLLSGALATLYFTTYFAYDAYAMLGQVPAFGILFLLSAYAVYASAWQYRQEVIGLIGLVGAYAVPLLLGGEQGNIQVLLFYILLIDVIILIIAFRLQWLYTNMVAFLFTWASYLAWFTGAYEPEQAWLAIAFGGAYFVVFQLMVLANKFLKEQPLRNTDITILLINNFIFYAIGRWAYEGNTNAIVYFSLANALLQGVFAALALRIKGRDPKVHYFFVGLALIFVGIAAFAAFDLQWLVAFGFAEALLLLAIGRVLKEPSYERFGYVVGGFAFVFLTQFWGDAYQNTAFEVPLQKAAVPMFFNARFVVSLSAMLCLTGALLIDMRYPLPARSIEDDAPSTPLFSQILQGLLVAVCYFGGYLEVQESFLSSASETRLLVLSAYSMLFLMAAGLCVHFIKEWRWMRLFWELAVGFQVLFFLSLYYPTLDSLRSEAFVAMHLPDLLWPRVAYLALFGGLLSLYYFLAIRKLPSQQKTLFSIGFQVLVLWLLSNEVHTAYLLAYPKGDLALLNNMVYYQIMLSWQALKTAPDEYVSNILRLGTIFFVMWALGWEITQALLLPKQGTENIVSAKQDITRLPYTLTWSLYAFGLTVYGFAVRKRLFRFSGLGILAIVLLKVLFWDLQYTSTLSKVITFISFGVLLLIVSFLYQKFKHLLLMEDK